MKGYFVYMFLDMDDNVLYIGSSIHLVVRIEKQHFLSQHGNLSEECILITHKVLYHQGVSSDDMKVKERYLINTLDPKYNDKMKNNSKFSFVIDNIDWKLYSLDTESLIEKRQNSSRGSEAILNHLLDIKNLKTKRTPPYYTKIEYQHKNNYYIIKYPEKADNECPHLPIEYSNFYVFLINNEYYIKGFYLNFYTSVNYLKHSELHLNNEDFLQIEIEGDRDFFIPTDFGFDSEEWNQEPFTTIKYETVKRLELLEEEIICFLDKKINKLRIVEST
jgi:hypothetical protein